MQLNDILIRNNFIFGDTVRLSKFVELPAAPTEVEFVGKVFLEHGKPGGYVRDINLPSATEYFVDTPASQVMRWEDVLDVAQEDYPTVEDCWVYWQMTTEGPCGFLRKSLTFTRVDK